MGKLAALFRLGLGDKLLFTEATLALARARLSQRTRSYEHFQRGLSGSGKAVPSSEPADAERVQRVGRAVRVMARNVPWEAECLVQAMAARRMLKRRGIESTICVGVAKRDGGDLESHAWLRCGELILTGAKGHERFRVITTFSD